MYRASWSAMTAEPPAARRTARLLPGCFSDENLDYSLFEESTHPPSTPSVLSLEESLLQPSTAPRCSWFCRANHPFARWYGKGRQVTANPMPIKSRMFTCRRAASALGTPRMGVDSHSSITCLVIAKYARCYPRRGCGLRMASARASRKAAPRAPSVTRWSTDKVKFMMGRTVGFPSTTTTRSAILPTARIAAWGGVMIALNESIP